MDRAVQAYDEEDLDLLADNAVRILDTIRNRTEPEALDIAPDATEVIERADGMEPLDMVGMRKASRDADVERGMAVLLEVLRHVGRGACEFAAAPTERRKRRLEARRAPRQSGPERPVAERPAPAAESAAGDFYELSEGAQIIFI